MPSPFPGMDPYFEGDLWTTFHTQCGVEIARQLTPKLAPRYIARAEKRYLVENQDGLEVEIESIIAHLWVEIRDTARQEPVTAIEFFTPANKQGENRMDYLRKRSRILRSAVHLMEIDLVRKGKRPPMKQPLPEFPYFVFLSRAERRPVTEIWPIAFNQPLPTVPIPLQPGDADVALDLQLAFTNVYDLNRFDLDIDYSRTPEAPLPTDIAAWAKTL